MNNIITCPVCGFGSENLTSHIATHGMSVKEFKKEFGLKYVQSDRLRAVHKANIDANNPTKGMKRSDSEIEKMSANRAGKGIGVAGKYERTIKIREKISQGVTQAHFRGDFDNARPGNGSFVFSNKSKTTIFARSTWEASLIDIFDRHPRITSVVNEPFGIPYMFEGAQHIYIPDFLVIYDGVIKSIWEVKRDDFLISDAKTIAKMDALEIYCRENDFNMFIINFYTL